MRKMRVRRQIEDTLRANPDGLTAGQILERLPSQRNVSDARHLANLLRGMKNIKKRTVKVSQHHLVGDAYTVNEYYYDDEGAEI